MAESPNPIYILAINPGATSTKIGIFDADKPLLKKTVSHVAADLAVYPNLADQYQYRLDLIVAAMEEAGIKPGSLKAVVGRGGLLKPLKGGTYSINETMLEDLSLGTYGVHASNLGALIACNLGRQLGIPSFIVDPVCVDEFEEVARVSGLPDLERKSQSHALNMKAVARRVAASLGMSYFDLNLVVVHLGSGISVSAHRKGRMIDVNNANNEGPFAPERCGGLPTIGLVQLCYSGKYTQKEMEAKLTRDGGMYAYLGTKDIREVEAAAEKGDEKARLILEAMAYQVAKETGAMATVLEGDVDRIIITGGIANSQFMVERITRRVRYIAPIVVVPGEEELEALAEGALRVLRGEERPQTYS